MPAGAVGGVINGAAGAPFRNTGGMRWNCTVNKYPTIVSNKLGKLLSKYRLVPRSTLENYARMLCNVSRGKVRMVSIVVMVGASIRVSVRTELRALIRIAAVILWSSFRVMVMCGRDVVSVLNISVSRWSRDVFWNVLSRLSLEGWTSRSCLRLEGSTSRSWRYNVSVSVSWL